MKLYIILTAALAAFLFGAYWAGGRIAAERCRASSAARAASDVIALSKKYNEQKRKVNAETFNTGTDVIRSRLHERYTIAD